MEEIKEKIAEILKRQELTEKAVKELQQLFYEEILAHWGKIQDVQEFENWYNEFNNTYHKQIIANIVSDMDYILTANLEYFSTLGLTDNVAAKVINSIVNSMGVDSNGKIKDGYFKNILQDTSIKRTVYNYIQSQIDNTELTREVRAEIKQLIKGKDGQLGIFEKMYSQSDRTGSTIFDIYQRADRIAGSKFAKELGLQAAIYSGGLIAGSRDFCIERNGKVYLIKEIKKWSNLSFQGKPVGYDPIIHLGGYRCRHFWGWLSNQTAMRLDKTIKEDNNGKLYRI